MRMKKRLLMMKMMLLVFILILTMSGCDDKKADSSHESDFLNRIIDNKSGNVNVKQRARLALSKLEDGFMDPEPFLIGAIMSTVGVEAGEIMSLTLIVYDEDADYIGFVVEEEGVDSNNVVTTQLVEKYPAYTYASHTNKLDFISIPVLERDENQRKSEDQWLKYINTPLQQQKEEYKKRTEKNWTWLKTLPPVWLSIQDTGKLNVYIRVYDKAGHLSERIPMVYSQKKWQSEK